VALLVVVMGVVMPVGAVSGAVVPVTLRVDVSSSGVQANRGASRGVISGDGRYVAFDSGSTNIGISPDTNGATDVYMHDLVTGRTWRVSVTASGRQANGSSSVVAVSGDGSVVVFNSDATNLVPGDTNGLSDVFIRNTRTHVTKRVSVTSAGKQNDRQFTGVGQAMSANGRWVVMTGWPGVCGANGCLAIRDRTTAETHAIPLGQLDVCGGNASVSNNGRFVAFPGSACGNTGGVFVRDRLAKTTQEVDCPPNSMNGFCHDRGTSMSKDGRYVVVWGEEEGDYGGMYVKDRQTGSLVLAGPPPGGAPTDDSKSGAISGNGEYVTYTCSCLNPAVGDTNGQPDIFRRDTLTGNTILINVSTAGQVSNSTSYYWSGSSISADGNRIVFASDATNLVRQDTNGAADVFVRILGP
jgi:Tol biopolymer transport system component